MNSVPTAYRFAVAAARAVAPVLARTDSKLGRGMAGRRDAHRLLERWANTERKLRAPLAWFHAPSVGEGLQARAVMEALRALHPDLQVVYTYFSPSAEPLGARFGADFAGYLPWDQDALVGPVLDALAPDLLVFTKTEVWPVLAGAAHRRGVPVTLAAGTVPPDAGRLKWPARSVLGSTWAHLTKALACSDDDAARLRSLGVTPAAVQVTGDPGIDASAARAAATDLQVSHLAPFLADPKPTVVAGSTWPSDEAVLLPALSALRERMPELRVVLAPHEPTGDRVGSLIGEFMERGWHPSTLAHIEKDALVGGVNAIMVERVGVLADLYMVGDLAFVGGGFHDAGLHSVLEPAAAGLPVLFGPRHRNARAAAELVELGAAAVVSDSDETATVLARWFEDAGARRYAAERSVGYIEAHRGAAERTALELSSLMKRPERS